MDRVGADQPDSACWLLIKSCGGGLSENGNAVLYLLRLPAFGRMDYIGKQYYQN